MNPTETMAIHFKRWITQEIERRLTLMTHLHFDDDLPVDEKTG